MYVVFHTGKLLKSIFYLSSVKPIENSISDVGSILGNTILYCTIAPAYNYV